MANARGRDFQTLIRWRGIAESLLNLDYGDSNIRYTILTLISHLHPQNNFTIGRTLPSSPQHLVGVWRPHGLRNRTATTRVPDATTHTLGLDYNLESAPTQQRFCATPKAVSLYCTDLIPASCCLGKPKYSNMVIQTRRVMATLRCQECHIIARTDANLIYMLFVM